MCFNFSRLNAHLQQHPFRPVFPSNAAATTSSNNGPVSMSVISSSSSSQNRRRSAPNPPQIIFCPNVTSSSQNQATVYGIPTFRPPGASQSHFLNPPNPAQNPYQNLLSAAAAAASSTSNQNQPRINSSSNGNNSNVVQQQPPPSSTSTSSAQGHFQNSNSSSGGGGQPGFNNSPSFPPSPFPLPQAHNHNHNNSHVHHAHPPPMHLSMHSPYYYTSTMSSRNPPYPPAPYSFPSAPHLSSSGSQMPSGGDVQVAHAQQADTSNAAARAAARLLPAHMQFYMQTATAGGMTETVGVTAAYPSFLAPSIHPPPLSPRH